MLASISISVTMTLLGGLMAAGVARADEPGPSLDAERVQWTELEFQASKLGLTATSTIRLSSVPRDQAQARLLAIEDVPMPNPSAPHVALVEIETVLRKRHSTIQGWFDPHSGRAFQREKLETGRKHYQRTDRLGVGAVHRRRRSPLDDGEIAAGPPGWTHREDEDVALPPVPADAVVSLPSALFYLVAAAPLEQKGDRLELYAFSRQSLDRLELEVLGRARVATDYRVEGAGDTGSTTAAKIDALCIAVRATPVNVEDSDASFQFLGLKGDVEIFLDPATRLPVQVSGSTGVLGRLDVKLRRAVLPVE